eukprot:TRINITY_DN6283_c0_g1_i9.p1 TRINITY_DN6283_c0_g1~~TRINITY_DN6283_c0_g1_i9.p1  ORF type:complete len:446 (+),score=95.67 TRINITY_DN6283_c0_g1_i9:1241-2578(+)
MDAKNEDSPCQSIFFNGRDSEKPGELLWVDHEKKVCEHYFNHLSKAAVKARAEEILQNKKYAGQVLDAELEFTKSSEMPDTVEGFACSKYTANYSIKVKKFRKNALISEKDLNPFQSYFKETLASTELSQPSAKQTGTLDDIFMWSILKEISINAVKMREQTMEVLVAERYPLSYAQLALLFQFLSYASPDIAKVLEYVLLPRFKSVGFPLKLRIAIYLDVTVNVSLHSLKLESPSSELMAIHYSFNKLSCLEKLNSGKYIESNRGLETLQRELMEEKKGGQATFTEQIRFKSEPQIKESRVNLAEESECLEDMTEAVDSRNELKNFADHCSLNVKTMSVVRRARNGPIKLKIRHEEKKSKGLSKPAISAVFSQDIKKIGEGAKKDFKRTMTLSKHEISAHGTGHSISRINLKKRDLLRLFRFSLRGKLAALPNKSRDVDVSLNT